MEQKPQEQQEFNQRPQLQEHLQAMQYDNRQEPLAKNNNDHSSLNDENSFQNGDSGPTQGTSRYRCKRVLKVWSSAEDQLLMHYYKKLSGKWDLIAEQIPQRNASQCAQRYRRLNPTRIRAHWNPEEDEIVKKLVKKFGKNWGLLASNLEGRNGKQVRERYINCLDPNINWDPFDKHEDAIIWVYYREKGPKWSEIAKILTGRPENMIKNRYYAHLKRVNKESPEQFSEFEKKTLEECIHNLSLIDKPKPDQQKSKYNKNRLNDNHEEESSDSISDLKKRSNQQKQQQQSHEFNIKQEHCDPHHKKGSKKIKPNPEYQNQDNNTNDYEFYGQKNQQQAKKNLSLNVEGGEISQSIINGGDQGVFIQANQSGQFMSQYSATPNQMSGFNAGQNPYQYRDIPTPTPISQYKNPMQNQFQLTTPITNSSTSNQNGQGIYVFIDGTGNQYQLIQTPNQANMNHFFPIQQQQNSQNQPNQQQQAPQQAQQSQQQQYFNLNSSLKTPNQPHNEVSSLFQTPIVQKEQTQQEFFPAQDLNQQQQQHQQQQQDNGNMGGSNMSFQPFSGIPSVQRQNSNTDERSFSFSMQQTGDLHSPFPSKQQNSQQNQQQQQQQYQQNQQQSQMSYSSLESSKIMQQMGTNNATNVNNSTSNNNNNGQGGSVIVDQSGQVFFGFPIKQIETKQEQQDTPFNNMGPLSAQKMYPNNAPTSQSKQSSQQQQFFNFSNGGGAQQKNNTNIAVNQRDEDNFPIPSPTPVRKPPTNLQINQSTPNSSLQQQQETVPSSANSNQTFSFASTNNALPSPSPLKTGTNNNGNNSNQGMFFGNLNNLPSPSPKINIGGNGAISPGGLTPRYQGNQFNFVMNNKNDNLQEAQTPRENYQNSNQGQNYSQNPQKQMENKFNFEPSSFQVDQSQTPDLGPVRTEKSEDSFNLKKNTSKKQPNLKLDISMSAGDQENNFNNQMIQQQSEQQQQQQQQQQQSDNVGEGQANPMNMDTLLLQKLEMEKKLKEIEEQLKQKNQA